METRSLVKQAKNGDKKALVHLIMDSHIEYYKLAYVYMKNKEDTLDCIQDMIILLYENISKLKNDESFYSWSKTILVNLCKKKLKKRKKFISIEDIKEEPVEAYGNSEEKISLEKYVIKLSDKHQEVIKLRYYLDLDYETISEILKIPLGSVKSRLHLGLKNLKELLGGEYFHE